MLRPFGWYTYLHNEGHGSGVICHNSFVELMVHLPHYISISSALEARLRLIVEDRCHMLWRATVASVDLHWPPVRADFQDASSTFNSKS